MPKYVKTIISGPYDTETLYTPLDEGENPTEATVQEIGQDAVNERYSWGAELVDEDDVPEDERI